MNREQILSVLYDLSLTIGGETSLDGLLRKFLQRLLFHTSFPAGVVLTMPQSSEFGISALLDSVIGDYRLAERRGSRLNLPEGCWNPGLNSWTMSGCFVHCPLTGPIPIA
jgi:hypothetical protein